MAFIKTDKNIYEVVKETEDFWIVIGKRSGTTYKKYKKTTAVIEEADNVEDLFDEMVCDERLIARYCNLKETIKRLLSEGKTIYGMIWASGPHGEPILKPVAKLCDSKWRLV